MAVQTREAHGSIYSSANSVLLYEGSFTDFKTKYQNKKVGQLLSKLIEYLKVRQG